MFIVVCEDPGYSPGFLFDMKKICCKCLFEREVEDFHKCKSRRDGLNPVCKECCSTYSKSRWQKIKKGHKANRNRGRVCRLKTKTEYIRERRRSNVGFRVASNLRKRLWESLQNKRKVNSFMGLMGCSILELKVHLEGKFDVGMTWDNYGAYWHIDHIKPCAAFDLSKDIDQMECFHYTNLQPLEKTKNLKKGKTWGGGIIGCAFDLQSNVMRVRIPSIPQILGQ